jgi:hypothetical protein
MQIYLLLVGKTNLSTHKYLQKNSTGTEEYTAVQFEAGSVYNLPSFTPVKNNVTYKLGHKAKKVFKRVSALGSDIVDFPVSDVLHWLSTPR